jgi:hypothetical protein
MVPSFQPAGASLIGVHSVGIDGAIMARLYPVRLTLAWERCAPLACDQVRATPARDPLAKY